METLTTITSGVNVPSITGYENILQGVRFPSVSWSATAPAAAPAAVPAAASKKDEEGTSWWVWLIIVLVILGGAALLVALKYKQNQR